MSEVSTMRKVHPENRVSRLARGKIDRHVGLRSGVRLDIGMICAKKFLGPINGELLDNVNVLASSIITLSGISLGVFVGHDRTLGLQDRFRNKVFGGYQLQIIFLSLRLMKN